MARITCVHCSLPLLETRTNPDPQTLREAAELYSRRCVCRLPNDTLQGLEDGTPEALAAYRQFLATWLLGTGGKSATADVFAHIRYPLASTTQRHIRQTLERRLRNMGLSERIPCACPDCVCDREADIPGWQCPDCAEGRHREKPERPAPPPFPRLERMLNDMHAPDLLRRLAHKAAKAMHDEQSGMEMVRAWKGQD